ncbi:Cysteine--tRNA ligase [Trichinella spiralis]|uniref:Cysteine--tRNA ligase n=1 Tax=Trichinella spiralis TaxID=6334 RepID=A0ABR3KM08_TRISP
MQNENSVKRFVHRSFLRLTFGRKRAAKQSNKQAATNYSINWLLQQWLTDRPRGTIWCPAVISKAGGDLVNEHNNNDDQTASSFLHNSTNKANSVHTRCDSSNSPACRIQSAWTPVNRADHPKLAPVAIGTLRRSIIIRPFSTFPHGTTQYKSP